MEFPPVESTYFQATCNVEVRPLCDPPNPNPVHKLAFYVFRSCKVS
jgi:hypothetical protein